VSIQVIREPFLPYTQSSIMAAYIHLLVKSLPVPLSMTTGWLASKSVMDTRKLKWIEQDTAAIIIIIIEDNIMGRWSTSTTTTTASITDVIVS